VLFADENNIGEITKLLASTKVNELIIYGIVDRAVVQSLGSFNPIIINKGDKFSDNVEIVKRYQNIMHKDQAVFTNGDFIETEIMSGKEPVVFIGRNNVPDVVQKYIPDSGIDIGVLIGNELVSTATFVRRQLGISVFVKFAQGARAPTGPVSRVEALDMFYLPKVEIKINIAGLVYNTATNTIEVTYQNQRDVAAFVKGTFTITTEKGERIVVGDNESVFVDPSGAITIVHNLTDKLIGNNITAKAFVIFGSTPKSMEYTLDTSIAVSQVNVLDNAMVNLTSVYYDIRKQDFVVEVENTGKVDAYVDMEIRDVKFGYNIKNYGLDEVGKLAPGEKRRFRIHVDEKLLEDDLIKNKLVKVRVYYGERKGSLVKVLEASMELGQIKNGIAFWIIVGVLVIILILLLKFRVKCDNCGHRNFIWRSHCKKCGERL